MQHWGHGVPKRTILVSNRRMVSRLDRGKLKKAQKKSQYKTAVVYFDKQGRKRYTGKPSNLKKSGAYPATFASKIVSMLPELQAEEMRIQVAARCH